MCSLKDVPRRLPDVAVRNVFVGPDDYHLARPPVHYLDSHHANLGGQPPTTYNVSGLNVVLQQVTCGGPTGGDHFFRTDLHSHTGQPSADLCPRRTGVVSEEPDLLASLQIGRASCRERV